MPAIPTTDPTGKVAELLLPQLLLMLLLLTPVPPLLLETLRPPTTEPEPELELPEEVEVAGPVAAPLLLLARLFALWTLEGTAARWQEDEGGGGIGGVPVGEVTLNIDDPIS